MMVLDVEPVVLDDTVLFEVPVCGMYKEDNSKCANPATWVQHGSCGCSLLVCDFDKDRIVHFLASNSYNYVFCLHHGESIRVTITWIPL